MEKIRRTGRGAISMLLMLPLLLSYAFSSAQTYGTDFSQSSNNNGNAGQGNIVWIGSIIQQSNSAFYEGQSIYQRFFLMNIPVNPNGTYKLEISHQATKGGIHAYDFVTNWPQGRIRSNLIAPNTYVNDNPCNNLGSKVNATQCAALTANLVPVQPVAAGDYTSTVSNGDNVADRVTAYDALNGGANNARGIQMALTRGSDNANITSSNRELVFVGYTTGSDQYAQYELRFTGPTTGGNFNLLVQLAGHLGVSNDGSGVSYGAGKGSSNINGGPYHFKLGNFIINSNNVTGGTSANSTSLGSQDNQIKGADILIPPPPCTITPAGPICAGESASFSGPSGVGSYLWTINPTTGVSLVGATTQTVTVNTTSAASGTYTIQLQTTTLGASSTCTTTLTVNSRPGAPSVSGSTRCGAGTVTFTASGCTGTITWYSAASGGSVLGNGTQLLRTIAAGTSTTVWASCTNAAGCEGPRQSATSEAYNVPDAPSVQGSTRCGAGTVTFTASGCTGTITWYSAASGGSVLGNGTQLLRTIAAGTSTTVWASCTNANGCEGPRQSATSEAYNIPDAPSVQGSTRCGAGTVTFTASGCTGTITWYSAASGGSVLGNSTQLLRTIAAGTSTTVWASCTNANGCEGPRNSATSTAYDYPTVSVTASPTVINLLGPNRESTLTATGSTATYTWSAVLEFPYSDGSGLLSSNTGATVTVTVPNAVTAYKYMVTAEGPGGCTSTATVVVETIANFSCPDFGGPDNLCVGSAGTFTSTEPPQYVTYTWSAEGATVSGTGTSVQITPTVAGVYTVTITITAESGWPEPIACTITRTAVDCNLNGCSPGFFKNTTYVWDELTDPLVAAMPAGNSPSGQPYRFTSQTSYKFNTYFGLSSVQSGIDDNASMLDVIGITGGGCLAVARQGVAALLGKAAFGSTYAFPGSFAEIWLTIKSTILNANGTWTCATLAPALNAANSQETNCSALKSGTWSPTARITSNIRQPMVNKLTVLAAPNPFFDNVRFTISTPIDGNVRLEVVNLLGQRVSVVYSGYMKANTSQVIDYRVPASAPQNLIYILRAGDEQVTGKLLKTNQ